MGNKRKEKKSKKHKGKIMGEQGLALSYVHDWVFRNPSDAAAADDQGFLPPAARKITDSVVFELHCHSNRSDGFLSPAALVERAHRNGVNVLALTDHDTMAGISEAMQTAQKYGIRIIPGVEISAVCSPSFSYEEEAFLETKLISFHKEVHPLKPHLLILCMNDRREEAGIGEPVHILAYYGSSGPSRYEDLDNLLSNIRDGRYERAKNMLLKLAKLKVPIKWEHVAKITGEGVAPGRVHIARAMVEAGHVENLREAFNRYLYDGGPAYALGTEPSAEEVLQLIHRTGGISALAHPWALKNPIAVIRSLNAAGLHAMEVYRSDGKASGYGELADTHELIKIGGSDYHGRGGHDESDLGSVRLPLISIYRFLKVARPIWYNATKDILQNFAEDPSNTSLEKIMRFLMPNKFKGFSTANSAKDIVDLCVSSWLTKDEKEENDFDEIRHMLADTFISNCSAQMSLYSSR
ncbi:5'-3' exoribonuclease-like isoform X1 [Zingiber officinale]|uniref:5'-3' exoribonuclease-like isoform X1 n=1 Tax=Zingiber officinale TaxID=94328 RepID=UPI001C4CEFC1|nr:5'-3' exoribonuclease-like isoform X1 [Zingiber officinale]